MPGPLSTNNRNATIEQSRWSDTNTNTNESMMEENGGRTGRGGRQQQQQLQSQYRLKKSWLSCLPRPFQSFVFHRRYILLILCGLNAVVSYAGKASLDVH
jgi:hypothetical protein